MKAVLFDLDGTLIDSMWMWKSIDIEYLARYGLKCPDDLQAAVEGKSFSETANYFKERFLLSDSLEKIKSDWNEMAYRKYMEEVSLKAGVLEFLKSLKQIGMKTGIATSNSRYLAEAVLKRLDIYKYFDAIHTSCEVDRGKPEPDIYLYVAKQLQVYPEHCLVFEDIIQGLLAGKRAGMKTCAVYDYYSKEQDKEKKEIADYYIKDYTKLVF